jgi:radical SAM superfamily enzyme YgiQ (UPF0313 family)
LARARGAWVVYGGIHATLFPEEALERGEGHAAVKGDGDVVWAQVVADCLGRGGPRLREPFALPISAFTPQLRKPVRYPPVSSHRRIIAKAFVDPGIGVLGELPPWRHLRSRAA